jgi:hypothetical protein
MNVERFAICMMEPDRIWDIAPLFADCMNWISIYVCRNPGQSGRINSNGKEFLSNYELWLPIPRSSCGFPTNVVSKAFRDHAGAGCSQANVLLCLIWVTTSGRMSSGAGAPQSGWTFQFGSGRVDGVDIEVFQFFLDEMAKAVPKKRVCVRS